MEMAKEKLALLQNHLQDMLLNVWLKKMIINLLQALLQTKLVSNYANLFTFKSNL